LREFAVAYAVHRYLYAIPSASHGSQPLFGKREHLLLPVRLEIKAFNVL